MTKMKKFILKNFNLTEEDLIHVDSIVSEIETEYEDGIGEYELYDVFDQKLYERIEARS